MNTSRPASIDDTDREIIRQLQADGRMSYSRLGEIIELSGAAIRQRVNRLIDQGVIDIVAVTDPQRIGLGYQAMLGIVVSGDARKVAAELEQMTDTVYVVLTAGRYDVIVELVCKDTDTFVDCLTHIKQIPGLQSMDTMSYLDITKQTYDWGVG